MTRTLLATAALCLLLTTPALATHSQPPLDINHLKYEPIGHFKPGDPIPRPDTGCESDLLPMTKDGVFNPSGRWNAFDTNVFETICLPFRAPGDENPADVYGNGGGESRHGYCANSGNGTRDGDFAQIVGDCPNHQLEYISYFEKTMGAILEDFGVTFQQYEFTARKTGNTLGGRAINPAAIVPGADHPDEQIVIGAHYDQTNDGQASAWDSQEGHAELIRVAKLMADYWKATGTRPSATVKFIPWDAEEGGTLGSANYVQDTVPPKQETKVRGYWNTDPCAGGYPSYRFGNPGDRVDMGIQLGRPDAAPDDAKRIEAFNAQAVRVMEQTLEHIDDTVPIAGGVQVPTFIATEEGTPTQPSEVGLDIFIGFDQPVLFASDWRNFIRAGIPFFNPGPEVTGPNSNNGDLTGTDPTKPGNPDALVVLHSPNDNIEFMQRYTGAAAGMSESWMKGMEFCSHMLGWGMLQHDQGGAQSVNGDVVAYFEALPNEAERNRQVHFDAGGSHQYADPTARTLVSDEDLDWEWDFGDRSPKAYGKEFKHAYRFDGTFDAKLTVTNIVTGQQDSMTIPIVVEQSGNPAPPAENPGAPKKRKSGGSSSGCASTVSIAPKGSALSIRTAGASTVQVFQASSGRKALRKPKRVARLKKSGSFTWDALKARKAGIYEVRVKSGGVTRRFTVERRGKKLRLLGAPAIAACGAVQAFGVSSPAFGGRVPLRASATVAPGTKAQLAVYLGRSKKPLKRATVKGTRARLTVPGRARRGVYRVVLSVDGRAVSTVYAKRV